MKWNNEKLVELGLEKYMKWHLEEERKLKEEESLVGTDVNPAINPNKTLAARIEALEKQDSELYKHQDNLSLNTTELPDVMQDAPVDMDMFTAPQGVRKKRTRKGRQKKVPHDINMQRLRKLDRQIGTRPLREFGLYACERPMAKELFMEKGTKKPNWAVEGLVMLRDGGLCRVCGERLTRQAGVKQLIPYKLGGEFSEPNCVTVCSECNIVWTEKNFYLSDNIGWHFLEHRLYLLRRRQEKRCGARSLSQKGEQVFYELRQQKERKEVGDTLESAQTAVMQKIAQKERMMDPLEFQRWLARGMKGLDDSVSNNEVKESEKPMNVEE